MGKTLVGKKTSFLIEYHVDKLDSGNFNFANMHLNCFFVIRQYVSTKFRHELSKRFIYFVPNREQLIKV